MLSSMWDLPGSRVEQADSFTTELPRQPTSDPLYHLLSDSSPLEPSHVTVKMTFEVVQFSSVAQSLLVLFSFRGKFCVSSKVFCFFFYFLPLHFMQTSFIWGPEFLEY